MRVGAFLAGCIATGCGNNIALGSECPPFGMECRARTPRDRGDHGAAQPNGSTSDAQTPRNGDLAPASSVRDGGAGAVSEAGSAPAGPRFPAIENGSFEITTGSARGGVLSSFTVRVAPWVSCSPPGSGPGAYPLADLRGTSPVGEPEASEQLAPSDGAALVNASPDGTALAQRLREPLREGVRYAFMVDLASTAGTTDLSLEVQGSAATCFAPQRLATAGPARPGVWTAFCVNFTPARDHRSLVLSATSRQPATGTRLFIDHLRANPRCE